MVLVRITHELKPLTKNANTLLFKQPELLNTNAYVQLQFS
jgi:hypothetical protein